MSLAEKSISADRINFSKSLSRREIKKLLNDKDLKVLQIAEPAEEKTLRRLNDSFFVERPGFGCIDFTQHRAT